MKIYCNQSKKNKAGYVDYSDYASLRLGSKIGSSIVN